MEKFSRNEMLFGKEALKKLNSSRVAVFGIGGVGGYALEALVRAGVGEIDIIDSDLVATSNINRQIIATTEDSEMHLYGIPCRDIPGIEQILYSNTADLYLCVFPDTGNDANALKFTDIFVRDMLDVQPIE